MINRTLVASLMVFGLGLAVVPSEASARAGGVGVSGGRVSFHVGARIAPRPLIRNPRIPLNTIARGQRIHGKHVHGKPFHNRHHGGRDRNFDGTPSVVFVPDSGDYPYGGYGPMGDPTYTGAVPSGSGLLDPGTADLAQARSCKATTQMVPSESGGRVPVTITRCRPVEE